MGMYNEVFKRCPNCGYRCTMQIPQVELGFGGYDLDNPSTTISHLSVFEKRELAEYVGDRVFHCEDKDCGRVFSVQVEVGPGNRVTI